MVKLAVREGGEWSEEIVDLLQGLGTYTSLKLDPMTGNPSLSYSDAVADQLKFAVRH